VGPEVVAAALRALRHACDTGGVDVEVSEHLVGGRAIDECGGPLPDETLAACQNADAVLFGAVGGPAWDHLRGEQRCEHALLTLRSELGLFANLRPVRVHARLAASGPLRTEVVRGTDLVIVRELTGGAYFGTPRERKGSGPSETARDSIVYSAAEVERVARVAFRLAESRRRHLISVDKANVLASSQLWRDTVTEVATDFPEVTLEHRLVDSFAMDLMQRPTSVDVVVTENLFGDILSDEAAVLAGSLGMLPSASLGDGGPSMYEPIHGSAPAVAGRGVANPYGAILSAALLLRHALGREDLAANIETAVDASVDAGVVGPDLGGEASTRAISDSVMREMSRQRAAAVMQR